MGSGYSAEMKGKAQELINMLQRPYGEFLQCSKEFHEQMQNRAIATLVNAQLQVKVHEVCKYIMRSKQMLERSIFFREFMKQMLNPEMVARIKRVIATDPHHSKLQLVLYGVGRLNPVKDVNDHDHPNFENSHMQFAFALLLRGRFPWVNDIEVYDPLLSPLDRRVINAFNCTCLCVDEDCKRTVDRPTLFFMPHCPLFLYENVLKANWTPGNLNKIIILSNSFSSYKHKVCLDTYRCEKIKAVLNSDHVMHEIALPVTAIFITGPPSRSGRSLGKYTTRTYYIDGTPVFRRAFRFTSWHFFAWNASLDDLNLDLPSKDYAQEA